MKIVIYAATSGHQQAAATAFAAGLARHGLKAPIVSNRQFQDCDLAVFWSHRHPYLIKAVQRQSGHYLVMERGYLGDRFHWTSLGFDGLNGRAVFPDVADGGERFRRRFGDLLVDWEPERPARYAVIMGQTRGDAALGHLNFCHWVGQMAEQLSELGYTVRLRPHPQDPCPPTPVPLIGGTLHDALSYARLVVTYNSNSAVDAVLNGIPAVSLDAGSMAWAVTSHDLGLVRYPERADWCRRLAWCQWSAEEIRAGDAWAVLQPCLDHLTGENR